MLSPIQKGNDQDAQLSSQSTQDVVQNKKKQKPSIQAKQRPVQAKHKPVQAKQRPVQAKQRPVQRNHSKGTVQRNGTQGDGLKEGMGNQYGVDLSGYKEHKDSSFPGSVGAAATIQGKDIHYAPGQFTLQNRKHEFGHAIDNAKNGTPKGDKVVNGQSVDTTREAVADKIMNTPLQAKMSEGTSLSTAQNTDGPLQARFIDEQTEKRVTGNALDTFYNQFKQSKSFSALAYLGLSPQEIENAFETIDKDLDDTYEIPLHKDGFFGIRNEKSFKIVGETICGITSKDISAFQVMMKSPGQRMENTFDTPLYQSMMHLANNIPLDFYRQMLVKSPEVTQEDIDHDTNSLEDQTWKAGTICDLTAYLAMADVLGTDLMEQTKGEDNEGEFPTFKEVSTPNIQSNRFSQTGGKSMIDHFMKWANLEGNGVMQVKLTNPGHTFVFERLYPGLVRLYQSYEGTYTLKEFMTDVEPRGPQDDLVKEDNQEATKKSRSKFGQGRILSAEGVARDFLKPIAQSLDSQEAMDDEVYAELFGAVSHTSVVENLIMISGDYSESTGYIRKAVENGDLAQQIRNWVDIDPNQKLKSNNVKMSSKQLDSHFLAQRSNEKILTLDSQSKKDVTSSLANLLFRKPRSNPFSQD